jgi:hypothetical protein
MSVTRIQIPETIVVPGKPLGRHIVIDSRSANFPAEIAPALRSVTHRSAGLPLTQARGSCTAEACCGALNTVPHREAGQPLLAQPDADALYNEEIILEGGNPATDDPGGSGTEVCQAAKNAGMLSGYQHATGINQALAALVIRPTISGVNWFTSFDTPNENGLIVIAKGASVRGGHEFVQVAIDVVEELVWCANSWGIGYGVPFGQIPAGCFCMSFKTWETLLHQGGDVTVPRTAPGWKASPLPHPPAPIVD